MDVHSHSPNTIAVVGASVVESSVVGTTVGGAVVSNPSPVVISTTSVDFVKTGSAVVSEVLKKVSAVVPVAPVVASVLTSEAAVVTKIDGVDDFPFKQS